jgi:thioredoxin-disulfide reductase
MQENTFDTIIIGQGPAGMSAGIYTARREMKTLIIGKDLGGQMAKTMVIENWPGVETGDGISLSEKLKEQTKSFGVQFETDDIESIEKDGDNFKLKSKTKEYFTKSVILAFGLEKRKMGIEGEEDFENKGISYCVTCDGPLFKGKNVAVVGGGNSGAEAVEFLAKICPKVYWIELMKEMRAENILTNRIKKMDNVEIMKQTRPTKLSGEMMLEKIKVETQNGEKELDVKGLIVEIGHIAKTKWLEGVVDLDEMGQIKVNEDCKTSTDGIFAAGDVTNTKYKQIAVASGMGAIAGLEAYSYIQKKQET